jgi:fermentation-respiration switch protein FrsA (DUF1100 family)
MSEDVTNTGQGEAKESSGLLLSVEPMQEGHPLSAQDRTDTDKDAQDSGDALVDVDGTDESDKDRTDAGGDSDETDTLGDADSTDAGGDSDGNDS